MFSILVDCILTCGWFAFSIIGLSIWASVVFTSQETGWIAAISSRAIFLTIVYDVPGISDGVRSERGGGACIS